MLLLYGLHHPSMSLTHKPSESDCRCQGTALDLASITITPLHGDNMNIPMQIYIRACYAPVRAWTERCTGLGYLRCPMPCNVKGKAGGAGYCRPQGGNAAANVPWGIQRLSACVRAFVLLTFQWSVRRTADPGSRRRWQGCYHPPPPSGYSGPGQKRP